MIIKVYLTSYAPINKIAQLKLPMVAEFFSHPLQLLDK